LTKKSYFLDDKTLKLDRQGGCNSEAKLYGKTKKNSKGVKYEQKLEVFFFENNLSITFSVYFLLLNQFLLWQTRKLLLGWKGMVIWWN